MNTLEVRRVSVHNVINKSPEPDDGCIFNQLHSRHLECMTVPSSSLPPPPTVARYVW